MSNKELTPQEQAQQDLPKKWYEQSYPVYVAGAASTGAASAIAYSEFIGGQTPLAFQIVGAVVSIIGISADRASTIKSLDANTRAKEAGLGGDCGELNPLGRNITNSSEFKRSIPIKAIDGAVVLLSTISPAGGIPVVGAKIIASFNNRRQAKRTDRAVEIAQERKAR